MAAVAQVASVAAVAAGARASGVAALEPFSCVASLRDSDGSRDSSLDGSNQGRLRIRPLGGPDCWASFHTETHGVGNSPSNARSTQDCAA